MQAYQKIYRRLAKVKCFKAKSYHRLNRESNQIKRILQQMARAQAQEQARFRHSWKYT
jgi:hypothetical protein